MPDPDVALSKMLRLFVLLFLLMCSLAVPAGAHEETGGRFSLHGLGFDDVQVTTALNFDVEYRPREETWVRDIIARANAARAVVNRATGDALMVRIRIVITPDRKTFLDLVGNWAENSSAVAAPSEQVMVINGDVMRAGPPGDLGTTLVHELAHLYLGVRSPKPVPRWLDEGLAQIIASQGSAEGLAALTLAKLGGRLIPLRDLERSFPVQGDRQRLAYQQSMSVVQHIIAYEHGNSLVHFIGSITGPDSEPEIERFWDPMTRGALEARWQRSIVSGGNWLALTLSSGLFWGAAALLTILAYIVKRRRNRGLREEWADEERIYEALDEEENRIYGDDDDDLVYKDEHELGGVEDWEDGEDSRKS